MISNIANVIVIEELSAQVRLSNQPVLCVGLSNVGCRHLFPDQEFNEQDQTLNRDDGVHIHTSNLCVEKERANCEANANWHALHIQNKKRS